MGAKLVEVSMLFLLSAVSVVTLIPLNASAQAQDQLTVSSQDSTGATITGYYAVLFDSSGNVLSTGFTPATFVLNSGASYSVQADGYGSCQFSYWADTGSSVADRPISISSNTQITAVYSCGSGGGGGGGGGSSSLTVNSVDLNNNAISGYYIALLDSTGNMVGSGFTTTAFSISSGATYAVQADGYGSCAFSEWSDGVTSDPRSFTASTTAMTFTAVYNCGSGGGGGGGGGGEPGGGSGTITIYDHRVYATYWAPCFAATCTNPTAPCNTSCTGPGAAMWVTLYNSAGSVVATGFSNENGLTFSGLSVGATYYLYPADCDLCHGSTHDVLFDHWGDGTTTRPLAVTVTTSGSVLDAWYICTNGCTGV